uniref:RNA-dependent RNA polymerase n=1 Tax=Shuangao Bedbug Virus 1 TaxID=1608071 RepID=A0A0B5KXV7_9RHAB|nr:RNA-dependent RNA polymerase [Shuangao Bedbug Virus 1]
MRFNYNKNRTVDIMWINDFFSISRKISGTIESMKLHLKNEELNQLSTILNTGLPERSKCIQLAINEDALNDTINNVSHNIPFYKLNECKAYAKSSEDIAREIVRCFKRSNYQSGFERPNKNTFLRCLRENVVEPMQRDFIIKDKLGPSFHLYYNTSDCSKKMPEIYNEWKSDLKYTNYDSNSCVMKDIFCTEFKQNDEAVFFSVGKVQNWQEVRKSLVKVREPKTLNWKGLSTSTKLHFVANGIGSKKAFKAERERKLAEKCENGESLARKNETIAFWTSEVATEVNNECDYMSNWLMEKSIVNLRIKNDWSKKMQDLTTDSTGLLKNGLLNCIIENLLSRNLALVCKHYEDVARGILFKSTSTNKGLHLLNFNNPNVFVVTLQGMDVYKDKGEIRFFTITRRSKHVIPHCFPNNDSERTISGRDHYYSLSKIYSFNKSRWEHFMKSDPICAISLVIYRLISKQINEKRIHIDVANVNKQSVDKFITENCKLLCLIYMSANYSGQNKMSGLIDNFRYMLPAALSDYSGLIDYVKSKFIIGLKSAVQTKTFYCMKRCIVSYMDESSKISAKIMKEQNVDLALEENGTMDTDTIGLKIPLRQAFGELTWDCREDAFAEIHLAFFLTAKDLYSDFHRNLDFYNSVVGGELEYNDKIRPLFKGNEENVGYLLRDWEKFEVIKRGGFFCQEAALLNGRMVNRVVKQNSTDIEISVENEGIYDNVMSLDFLTSTRSSLKNETTAETYTMLESCLDAIEFECPELIESVNSIIEWMKDKFKEAYESESDLLKSYAIDIKYNSSSGDADISETQSSSENVIPIVKKKVINKDYILDDDSFESSSGGSSSYSFVKTCTDTEKMYFTDKEKDMLAKLCIDYVIGNNSVIVKDSEMALVVEKFCRVNQNEFFIRISELEQSLNKKEGDYFTGTLHKLSLLNISFNYITLLSTFKMVPKGQRTWKDREIFIENKSRFVDAVLEHICKKICELIPEEQITRKGDNKAIDTKAFQSRAFKWKSTPSLNLNMKNPKKEVYFLTGDMTKWSNWDLMHRLHFLNNCYTDGLKNNFAKIMRTYGRTNGNRAIRLTDKFLENPLLMQSIEENLLKINSRFPLANIKQNWLQGIRNYNSTLAHYGAMESIRYILKELLGDEIYIDFLVHSDDFVMAIGLCYERNELGLFEKQLFYKDRESDYLHGLKPLEIINFICFVLKLNNNSVSIKKSSIHKLLVEFVSNSIIRGSICMSPEKQLLAVFSETSNLGNKDDVNGLLSNSNNAISKGAATSTIDTFLWFAMRKMRTMYSFNTGMRYDPVEKLGISRDFVPLQFFPDVKNSSILQFFTTCDIQDICNFIDLSERFSIGKLNESEERSLALYCALSKCYRRENIDTERFDTRTSYFCSFRFRLEKMKDNDISHKDCLPKYSIDITKLIDPTFELYRSHDTFSLLVDLHDRTNNTMIRQGLVRKTKASVIKLRGSAANEKNIRWSDSREYITMDKWFSDISDSINTLLADNMLFKSTIGAINTEIKNTFNFAIPTIKWLKNLKMGTVVERHTTYRNDLIRIPGIESENSTLNNKIGKLLTHEYCYPKYKIMNPYSINTYSIISELEIIRKKSKCLGLNIEDQKEMRIVINTLDKYYKESERSKLICTRATNQKFKNYEEAIKYIIVNNTVENSVVHMSLPGNIISDMTKKVNNYRLNANHISAIYTLERFAYYNNMTLSYSINNMDKVEFVRQAIMNVNYDRDIFGLKCAVWLEAVLLRTYTLAEKYDKSKLIIKYHKTDNDFEEGDQIKHIDAVVYCKYKNEKIIVEFNNGSCIIMAECNNGVILNCVKELDRLWKKYPINTYSADYSNNKGYTKFLNSYINERTGKGEYTITRNLTSFSVASIGNINLKYKRIDYSVVYMLSSDGKKVNHGDRSICNVSHKNTNGDFSGLNINIVDSCIIDLRNILALGNEYANKFLNSESHILQSIPFDLFDSALNDNNDRLKNALYFLQAP